MSTPTETRVIHARVDKNIWRRMRHIGIERDEDLAQTLNRILREYFEGRTDA